MKREGGGAEGGRLQAEDAASEAGLASCGRANTENDGEREGASVRPRPCAPKSLGTSADGGTELRTKGA